MAVFSIITINYNDRGGLTKTMDSVIGQTCKDIEYIVIDGGSVDGSVEVIKGNKAYVTYWVSEKDNGIYNAMNKGIEQATGDYVFFLNSGDFFAATDVLEKVLVQIQKQKDDIIYGNVLDQFTNKPLVRRSKWLISKVTLFRRMICHQTVFAKTTLFRKHGFFNETYKIKADYDWLIKNVFAGATYRYIDIDVVVYDNAGLSSTAYETISVHEIPLIRNTYYTPKAEKLIRKFFINPKITRLFSWYLYNPKILRLLDKFIES